MARASKRTARPAAPTARTPAPQVAAAQAEVAQIPAPAPAPEIVEEVVAAAPEPAPAEILAVEAIATVEAQIAETEVAETEVAATAAPDIAESFRALVVKGVGETRARFEAARIAGEQAFAAVEASYGAAQTGVSAFHVRAIEAIQAGANAQFGLLKALAGAKTVSDVVALHSEYARRQYEDTAARAKELAELARKVAEDSSAPLREHVAQAFHIAV